MQKYFSGRKYDTSSINVYSENKKRCAEDWIISSSAPFSRPRVPFSVKNLGNIDPVGVLGIRSRVWAWNLNKIAFKCNNPNCRQSMSYTDYNHVGHIFMFDVDEPLRPNDESFLLASVAKEFDVSHLVLARTRAGFHIISFDIRKNKIDWFPLFMRLKTLYKSDYEFSADWILRVGFKGNSPPPEIISYIHGKRSKRQPISSAHMSVYKHYNDLSDTQLRIITGRNSLFNSWCDLIIYKSWNYQKRKQGRTIDIL